MVTLKDIAKETGLDFRSVSHVLRRDDPRYSPQTRQRIHEAAARLGFVANHAARRLARGRSAGRAASFEQIGLIYFGGLDHAMDSTLISVMHGAEQTVAELDACLLFVRVNESRDWKKIERLVQAGIIDGWLVWGGLVDDGVVARLEGLERPCVVLGDHQCGRAIHSVNVDHAGAGRLAVEHLASLGHRRILMLHGSMKYLYQHQIRDGFRAAVKELGLDEDERLVAPAPRMSESDGSFLPDLLKRTGATAIFTGDSGYTNVISQWLKQAKTQIPWRVSLIGCEVDTAEGTGMNLSRVELPFVQVGRHGIGQLQKMVSEPNGASSQIKVSPRFIQGESTSRYEAHGNQPAGG